VPIYKCKLCGEDLEEADGSSLVTCSCCGNEQAVPNLSSPEIVNLFNNAVGLWRNNDLDSAQAFFNYVIENGDTDPEVYWMLLLCQYGVDYIEAPPGSKQYRTTCNKTLTESILDNSLFMECKEKASIMARVAYESEAQEIERIQREAAEMISSPDSYEVFVSFKQSDPEGNKTNSAVHAEDIYNALKLAGCKAFFSKETLRVGDWRNSIDAALASSKVMVLVGTASEYLKAPNVEYEWSRFIKLKRWDSSKELIPVYEGIRPSSFPGNIGVNNAYDMSDRNYIWGLVEDIKRLLDVGKATSSGVAAQQSNQPLATAAENPLVIRAKQLCEEGEFEKARDLVNDGLRENPRDGDLFFVALMIDYQCKTEDGFDNLFYDKLAENRNYIRAIQFGSEVLKAKLAAYAYNQRAKVGLDEAGWRALHIDKEKKRALIIAKVCVDRAPYDEPYDDRDEPVTWETSSLRKWLNNDYYENILSPAIKERIVETDQRLGKVFLLSVEDAKQYFSDVTDRQATFQDGSAACWWLRSPGYTSYAALVDDDGYVYEDGFLVNYSRGIRPALWLNI